MASSPSSSPYEDDPSEDDPLSSTSSSSSSATEDDDGDDVGDYVFGSSDGDDDDDIFDYVCALCDDGGPMLCCEGKCLRSFHATRDACDHCESLCMSHAHVQAIPKFYCPNCKSRRHQCFACGILGSSDASSNPEVFLCSNATCGHFYHPSCAVQLLFPDDIAEAERLEKTIAAGNAFTCPVHQCFVCKGRENKKMDNLRFAVCRRCPRAYHSMCLPESIKISEHKRIWAEIIPGRFLIYCMQHKIEPDIQTPIRNHIKFPDSTSKRSTVSLDTGERDLVAKSQADQLGKKYVQIKQGSSSKPSHLPTERQVIEDENTASCHMTKKPELQAKVADPRTRKSKDILLQTVVQNKASDVPSRWDKAMRDRIEALVKKSPITLDDILKRQKLPSTYSYSGNVVKDITLGKVEGSVEAVRAALQKLKEGASIEDAKAVCEPEIIKQIIKWKNKLSVYLAPVLHSSRYTSFGRHFTKPSKLQEIVDRLHWYVENGDMIVDFCCGANDFSLCMKEKLEETQKSCLFKNFDIIQPKKDFNFERKDWMKVVPADLPTGSKLVMGLNPPFGIKAALANEFINKACQFEPKLLILIVPEETKRLDGPYDIIWEDSSMFSGKPFYLPGSVDANGKQVDQWNIKPPHLYLWSRADWTLKHRDIARQQGHIFK